MTEERDLEISTVPTTYAQWLECFYVLQSKNTSKAEIELLSKGSCSDSAESLEYFETQLIKTLNIMIKRYINTFNKELEMYTMFNEYDDVHYAFNRLANKLRGCMFFINLDFMSVNFRNDLKQSVTDEINKFWNKMLKSIYSQCVEQNNSFLEDELYIIKRIKLFD